jgi:cytochrome c-type biogenesis protein CcmH
MRRIGTLFFLFMTMTLALVPAVKAQDGVSDDEVNAVAKKLYCPVCPNTPLDVCETQACQDWRAEIHDQLSSGWSEEEVMAYFVERYGERVLAEPQRGGFTSLVWILPVVAMLLGLAIVAQALRSWRTRRGQDAGDDGDGAVVRAGNVAKGSVAKGDIAQGNIAKGDIAPEARARIERELQELI